MAIDSVLSQTFTNWELIIVDDGSTDNTKEVVASYQDSRIRCIYQENAERSAARNKGIANANGEWICFLDSDDIFLPNYLSEIAEFLMSQNILLGLICSGLIRKESKKESFKPFLNLSNPPVQEIANQFLIPTQVCVHRSILEKEKFDIRFRLWEDTHLWMRIAAQYPIFQIEKFTAIQNIHEQGTVNEGLKRIRMKDVNQYIKAVSSLSDDFSDLFKDKFHKSQFNDYIDSKYKMYLYQARQNKQFSVALKIWGKALKHKASWYLLTELPKIFINKLGYGIHA